MGVRVVFLASAPWPSGKAEDCKSFIPGSNPGGASFVEHYDTMPYGLLTKPGLVMLIDENGVYSSVL